MPGDYEPVSLGKKALSTRDQADYIYDEIHRSSYKDILMGKN